MIAGLSLATVIKYAVAAAGWVVSAVKQFYSFVNDHKEEITAIVLRVQKDAADGYTEAEMEQMAVDLVKQYLIPKMSWYMKAVYNMCGGEKFLRQTIKDICAKSHLLAGNAITNPVNKPA